MMNWDLVIVGLGWFVGLIAGFVTVISLLIGVAYWMGVIQKVTIAPSKAVAFLFWGQHCCTAMQFSGHRFNNNGFIETGVGLDTAGGSFFIWRFWSVVLYFSWFVKPARYDDYNEKDGFGEGNAIILHEQIKDIILIKAETRAGATGAEAVPLDIKAFFSMIVVNPYLFLFMAPKNVVAQVIKKMEAIMRGRIRAHDPDEVQAERTNGHGFWTEIMAAGSASRAEIERMETEWGVKIVENSVEIRDIGYQKADQDAQEQAKQQKWKAKGSAAELLGSMLEIEAISMGLTDGEEARRELAAHNSDRLKEIVALANNTLIQRKLGEVGSYKRIDVPGLAGGGSPLGLDKLLAAGIALMDSMAQKTQPGSGDADGGKPEKDIDEMTDEELDDHFEAIKEKRRKK
jgi:hypothetical protein